jgi:hypothetical protein
VNTAPLSETRTFLRFSSLSWSINTCVPWCVALDTRSRCAAWAAMADMMWGNLGGVG